MKLPSRPYPHRGFSLIEVTLALSVAAFCLLTVFSLLPIGLNSNQNAAQQTVAAGIATAIAADVRATHLVAANGGASYTGTSSRFQLVLPQVPTNGGSIQIQAPKTRFFSADGNYTGKTDDSRAVVSPIPSIYRATITFTPLVAKLPTTIVGLAPVYPQNKTFSVDILITWPALADPDPNATPANYAGSFETVTTVNTNFP